MGNSYPQTKHEMRRAKYTFIQARQCKDCKTTVELWRTSTGKEISLDVVATDHTPTVLHRLTCTAALQQQTRRDQQGDPLYRFAAAVQASAVIVVDNGGNVRWALANLCLADPAEMHIILSRAADDVRDELVRRFSTEAA